MDVVVTDLALGDATREEVIQRLHVCFKDAAIVALTVLDDLATVQQVLDAGADGYVVKSGFDEGSLVSAVHRLLGAHA